MKTAAPPEYWNRINLERGLHYDPAWLPFKDIFDKYIKAGDEIFEVGCYPGGFLIYLSNRFKSQVHGIDITPDTTVVLPPHLSRHGAQLGSIVQGDFFQFEPKRQYAVVCSFGFLEHFFNFQEVIRKHIDLVQPGGLLVLACPNFRRGQFLLHWLLDRENLRRHVLGAMDLEAWRLVLDSNGMQVLEMGYYQTFGFWVEPAGRSSIANLSIRATKYFAKKINRYLRLPNPFISPFMYCVARKQP